MGIAMYLSMSRLLGYGIVTVCILCIMDDHLQTWHLHEDLQVIITPDMCPGQAVGMEPTPYSSHSCFGFQNCCYYCACLCTWDAVAPVSGG